MWEKVLVADDERQIRDLLNEFLTSEVYEVILAAAWTPACSQASAPLNPAARNRSVHRVQAYHIALAVERQ